MISIIGYFLAIFFLIIFLLLISFFLIADIFASFLGSPYVPTKHKIINTILENANLKKGSVFYELGSGDGRVVLFATKKYQVKGIGIEINPLLCFYAKIKARIERINSVSFICKNFFDINLKEADVVFIFLLPATIKKLKEKIVAECKKNVLIISHGFKIENWDRYLIKTLSQNPFSTYYYQLSNFP